MTSWQYNAPEIKIKVRLSFLDLAGCFTRKSKGSHKVWGAPHSDTYPYGYECKKGTSSKVLGGRPPKRPPLKPYFHALILENTHPSHRLTKNEEEKNAPKAPSWPMDFRMHFALARAFQQTLLPPSVPPTNMFPCRVILVSSG